MYLRKSIYLAAFTFFIALLAMIGIIYVNANDLPVSSEKDLKTYIVEMEDPSILDSIASNEDSNLLNMGKSTIHSLKESIKKSHENTLSNVRKKGINYNQIGEYTLSFNGFAVEISEENIDELASLPGVKSVYPDKQFKAELEESTPLIGATDIWEMPNDIYDKTTGKGITVAVIDSGVDYTHPDLGGKFGPGNKVVSGFDFVNNDDDPMDDHGHGTHVAGIIAANGELKGVAPDASILSYKVLNNRGVGATSDIVAAIEAAIDPDNPHRADIINLSLGGAGGGIDPVAIAAENAVKSGVSVVTSAGNTGPGYQTVSSPGGAEGVLTVGASTSGIKVPKIVMTSPFEKEIDVYRLDFSSNPQRTEKVTELLDVGQGLPKDLEGLDIQGKTLLIQSSSSYDFQEKAEFAEKMGAYAVIFYQSSPWFPWSVEEAFFNDADNNGIELKQIKQHEFESGMESYGRLDSLIAVEIAESSATILKEQLNGGSVELEISGKDASDQIPSFSSRGHAPNFNLSPNLVAPGVEIASTVPKSLNESGYARSSGTSMAAPHVAGSIALLRQLHPEWDTDDISNALVGTATPLEVYDPLTQGAGRLDIIAATDSKVLASPSSLSFGLANFGGESVEENGTVTLTNHGSERFEMELVVDNYHSAAIVEVNPSKMDLEPGQSVDIEVSISHEHFDQYLDIMGWIDVKVEEEHTDLRIPYYSAVRPLLLYTSPDPAVGNTETFIYSPVADIEAPIITLETPDGEKQEYTAVFDHGNWWKAPIDVRKQGLYKVTAETVTEQNAITLKGFTNFEGEITEKGNNGASNWQAIGPNAGGANLTMDPKDEDKMFAPRGSAGFFFTEDHADTWKERRNLPVAGGSIVKFVIDSNNSNKMYVAVNGSIEDPTYRGKLLMSDDAGMTWTTLPFPNIEMKDFMIDHTGNTLVAVTNNQILVTHDFGHEWEQITGSWKNHYESFLYKDSLYIGADNGLYVIRDISKGIQPAELLFESPSHYPWVQNVAGNADILLATTYFDGLYASRDNGESWFQLFNPNERVMFLRVIENRIFAGTLSEIWVSDDYGETWNAWDGPVPGTIETDISQPIKGHPKKGKPTYISAVNAGIFQTDDDGKTYNRFGVPGANVFDLAFAGDGKELSLIAGTQFDTYRQILPNRESIDASIVEWGMSGKEGTVGSAVYFIETSPIDPNIVYKVRMGAMSSFFLHKSVDGGKTWNTEMTAGGAPQGLFIHPANPEQIIIPYHTFNDRGVVQTNDGGASWEVVSMDRNILSIAGDPTNPLRFWTGSGEGLYVTEDGGSTFQKLQDIPISTLEVNPDDPEHLVFGGRDFFYSNDGGITIDESRYNELSIFVQDIVFTPGSNKVLYAATSSFTENGLLKGGRGVLRSKDGGRTWHSVSQGLNNKNAISLAIAPDAKHLYVGTMGGSVYRVKLNKGN